MPTAKRVCLIKGFSFTSRGDGDAVPISPGSCFSGARCLSSRLASLRCDARLHTGGLLTIGLELSGRLVQGARLFLRRGLFFGCELCATPKYNHALALNATALPLPATVAQLIPAPKRILAPFPARC
jgi:hypothetical protein